MPLLAGSLLAGLVLAPAVYLWHGHQVVRSADTFLARADSLSADDDWRGAADYVNRYLSLRPDDAEARIRLANTYGRSADTVARKRRAVDLYYRAVGLAERTPELEGQLQPLRVRLTELLLELGRFGDAQREAIQITAEPDDPTAMRLLALAMYGSSLRGTPASADSKVVEQSSNPYEVWSNRDVVEVIERAWWLDKNAAENAATEFEKQKDENPIPRIVIGHLDLVELLDPLFDAPPRRDVTLSVVLATIYRDDPNLPITRKDFLGAGANGTLSARGIMDELRDESSSDPDVLLAHFAFYFELAQRKRADAKSALAEARDALSEAAAEKMFEAAEQDFQTANEDLMDALDVARDNAAVVLAAADYYRSAAERTREDARPDVVAAKKATADQLKKALGFYEQLTGKIAPNLAEAYLGLGETQLALGNAGAAVEAWQQGIERASDRQRAINLRLRLAAVLVSQVRLDAEKVDEAEDALRSLDESVQQLASRLTKPLQNRLSRAVTSEWAQFYLNKGNYLKGIDLLEPLAAESKGVPTADKARLMAMRAGAHAQLGQWDLAASAYEEAFKLEPQNLAYHQLAGAAFANAGRPDRAVEHLQEFQSTSPEANLAYARALFQQQMARPKSKRNWATFKSQLDSIDAAGLDSPWRLEFLKVDYALAEDPKLDDKANRDEVVTSLAAAEASDPENQELMRRLTLVYARLALVNEEIKASGKAETARNRFADLSQSPAQVALLDARLSLLRGEHEKARKLLNEAIRKHPKDKRELQVGLAQVSLAEGNLLEATEELAASSEGKRNLERLMQLAELAVNSGDKFGTNVEKWARGVERWENELRKAEGDEGTNWRYVRATRLLGLAKSPSDGHLEEAALELKKIQDLRPEWSAAYYLAGRLAEVRGRREDKEAAVKAYRQAIELGDRRIGVYQKMIRLLLEMGRTAEAGDYLAQVEDYVSGSLELSMLAISNSISDGDIDRAVARAESGVLSGSSDPKALVFKAQILLLKSEKEEDPGKATSLLRDARQKLKDANDLTGWKNLECLSALFNACLVPKDKDVARARDTLNLIEKNTDEPQTEFVLAQGYELLGDRVKAKMHYETARNQAPENAAVSMRAALFYMRSGELNEAEEAARHMRNLLPDNVTARRILAAILASRASPEDLEESQEILEDLIEHSPEATTGDRVLFASTSIKQSQRLQLEREIRDFDKQESEAKRDQITKLLRHADQQYAVLVSQLEPNPTHVAMYADFLISQKEWSRAQRQILRLKRIEPNSARVVMLHTQRLAAMAEQEKDLASATEETPEQHNQRAQEYLAEADAYIDQWVARTKASLDATSKEYNGTLGQLYYDAARVYAKINKHAKAEEKYRLAYESNPDLYGPLALFLAAQSEPEKTQEALDICWPHVSVAKEGNLDAFFVLTSVLVTGSPTLENFDSAEAYLEEAVREHGDRSRVLMAVASIRMIQGRVNDAESLYQRAAALRPVDPIALNNLATLLLEQPGRIREAMQHIDQAIQLSGEQEALLDTKGMVLLNDGQLDKAVDALLRAAADPESDPRYKLHLFIALRRGNEKDAARKVWSMIDEEQLRRTVLTADDQREMREAKVYLASN